MVDRVEQERAHEIFDPIAARYLERDGVDIGPMFGSQGLRIRGKIFALVDYDGGLMLKVPAPRADALEAEGSAVRVSMAGRTMREWMTVSAERPELWDGLVAEAFAYLDEITP